jgi:hypothetical protein
VNTSPKGRSPSSFQLAIGIIVAVAAVAVVAASLRMTERAIDSAVAQREAASRFLADELSVLRLMALSSRSPVPARLYLGMEDCFKASVAMPFDGEGAAAARQQLAACAEMELGRLYAQGGAGMAGEGQRILREIGLLK